MITPESCIFHKFRLQGKIIEEPCNFPFFLMLSLGEICRYMSPTDNLVSPVSRGLQARTRRSMRPPQALVPPKVSREFVWL